MGSKGMEEKKKSVNNVNPQSGVLYIYFQNVWTMGLSSFRASNLELDTVRYI